MDIQNITNKESAILNEQQSNSKEYFSEIFKKILNSKSFKNEFRKLLTKQIC